MDEDLRNAHIKIVSVIKKEQEEARKIVKK